MLIMIMPRLMADPDLNPIQLFNFLKYLVKALLIFSSTVFKRVKLRLTFQRTIGSALTAQLLKWTVSGGIIYFSVFLTL